MAATLGLGGSAFDLLDQLTAPDPIVTGVNNLATKLFSNPGSDDFASFNFSEQTFIGGELGGGTSSLNFARITEFKGSFTFGSLQSIALGSNLFGPSGDTSDPVTFGEGARTTLNINLVRLVDFSITTTYEDDSLNIGSMSTIEPEDDSDFNLLA
jgi:hypothetical protein